MDKDKWMHFTIEKKSIKEATKKNETYPEMMPRNQEPRHADVFAERILYFLCFRTETKPPSMNDNNNNNNMLFCWLNMSNA